MTEPRSKAGAALIRRTMGIVEAVAAIEAEITEDILAAIYGDYNSQAAYVKVATYCDTVLDKSGGLLGRVRDKARYRYRPLESGLSQEQIDAGDFT
jgi:hypothetical protein